MMNTRLGILFAITCAAGIAAGCVSATATRTTANRDGTTSSDTITTKAFLGNISNGQYSNGTGMTLSVNSATPDQQSIAMLSGGIVDLSKAALLFAAKQPITNAAPAGTNALDAPGP